MADDEQEGPVYRDMFASIFGDRDDPDYQQRRAEWFRRDLKDAEDRSQKLKRRVIALESDARSLQRAARELAVAGLYGAIILIAALGWAAYWFEANWLQWLLLALFGVGVVTWFRGLCRQIDAVGRRT